MGRRRRRRRIAVVKKKLPTIFDCYICGAPKSIAINTYEASAKIFLKCGLCKEEVVESLGMNRWTVRTFSHTLSPSGKHEIAKVRIQEDEKIIEIRCPSCNQFVYFEEGLIDEWMPICSCGSLFKFKPRLLISRIGCSNCSFTDFIAVPRGTKNIDIYAAFQRA